MGDINRYAILVEPHHIEVQEEPVPTINASQILVQIKTCGLCQWEQNHWHGILGTFPQRIGHEWAGTVVAIGSEIKDVAVGDNVTGLLRVLGAFSDYLVVDSGRYFRLSPKVDPKYAIGEPLKCIVTVVRHAAPEAGDVGVVMGVGPMGLFCTQVLSGHLLSNLIAVDVNDERLAFARRYGATHTINARKIDPVKEIAKITGGRMADFVIDGTGSPETIATDSASLRVGRGRLIIMSSHQGSTLEPFDFRPFMDKGLMVQGAHPCSAFDELDDMRRAANLYSAEVFQVKPLVTNEFKLTDIQKAFEYYTNPEPGYLKGIVIP
jgi:threonine dehydrogenase-like Zn-dependent dehydrogenase